MKTGRIPGAIPNGAGAVFQPGDRVAFKRDVRKGLEPTTGVVVEVGDTLVRVQHENGNWAGATESYLWHQWLPIIFDADRFHRENPTAILPDEWPGYIPDTHREATP